MVAVSSDPTVKYNSHVWSYIYRMACLHTESMDGVLTYTMHGLSAYSNLVCLHNANMVCLQIAHGLHAFCEHIFSNKLTLVCALRIKFLPRFLQTCQTSKACFVADGWSRAI